MNKSVLRYLLLFTLISFFAVKPVYATSLRVGVYPTEIDQLGKYVIIATNSDGTPFTGTLQTQYWVCPLEANYHTDSGCSAMPTNSFVVPSSGKAVQDLAFYPNNYGPAITVGKYFTLWKPTTGNYDWSNETVVAVKPLDMKRYFNLTDGNYYRYNANNLKMNQTISDATRVDIKNETICNENVNSMFFSKTSKYAYWNPSYITNDGQPSDKITTSDFMVWRPRWNEKGELETKTWSNYKPNTLPTDLNTFPAEGFSFNNWKGQTYHRGIDYISKNPLSPYVYTLESLDLNKYGGPDGSKWYVTDEVRFSGDIPKQTGETESQYNNRFCAEAPASALTNWFVTIPMMKYYAKVIDTPAYKGPVAVVVMRESPKGGECRTIADFPNKCPGVLREDWFMAKDIGMVRFDVKNFGGVYDVPSPACSSDPDCRNDGLMANPFVKQQLTSYHVNYSQEKYLTITNQTSNSRKFNIHVNRNDFSDLNSLSTLNQIQLIVDDDANWDNSYGMRVMLHMRDNGQWKNANLVNGVYYVYEPERGGSNYGWQTTPITSAYSNNTLGFNVSLDGLLYDGENLDVSINENDGTKGFSLANKNMYLYLEGQSGVLGIIPLFAQGQETYQGYNHAKIGKFVPSTPTLLPGDLNHDGRVDILDLRQLLSGFTNIFDYNILVSNFGR